MAQVDGVGILEQLNRAFKYKFIFRYEVNKLVGSQALLPSFMQWFNLQLLHVSLKYRTTTLVLVGEPQHLIGMERFFLEQYHKIIFN